MSVAPWLTELEAVRVNMETFEALVAARPDETCVDDIKLVHRSMRPIKPDKDHRKTVSGSDALSETAFRNQLYTKRPDRELISRFKTKHQGMRCFLMCCRGSRKTQVLLQERRAPRLADPLQGDVARGFSLHSDTWTGRPLVVAWMRRVAVQPKEAIVSSEMETLEWLSRFALRAHVVRAIRSGHRVRSDFWKSASDPEMAKLLRAARWPMKWTPSVRLMSPATRRPFGGLWSAQESYHECPSRCSDHLLVPSRQHAALAIHYMTRG